MTNEKWLEPVPYGADRFEVQATMPGKGGSRRMAVVDRLEDARLISLAPELAEFVEKWCCTLGMPGPMPEQVRQFRKEAQGILSRLPVRP